MRRFMSDAQRAMRLIRARAGDYAILPGKVAMMGFSPAGGQGRGDLATRLDAARTLATCSTRPTG